MRQALAEAAGCWAVLASCYAVALAGDRRKRRRSRETVAGRQ